MAADAAIAAGGGTAGPPAHRATPQHDQSWPHNSLNLKVEDDCQLTSLDELATAAHHITEKIQEEQECVA